MFLFFLCSSLSRMHVCNIYKLYYCLNIVLVSNYEWKNIVIDTDYQMVTNTEFQMVTDSGYEVSETAYQMVTDVNKYQMVTDTECQIVIDGYW